MNLECYLKEKNIPKQAFAKRIQISNSYISLIINGKRKPSLKVARLIIKETKGKVNVADLFEPDSTERLFIKGNIEDKNL